MPPALFHKLNQLTAARRVAQFIQRLSLNLANALASNIEYGSNLFKGAREVIASQTKSEPQNLFLALGKRF